MNQMRFSWIALSLAGLVAGCATTPPPPPPQAVSEITGKTCTDKPDLTKAIAMTPKRKAQWHSIATNVDGLSPCLNLDGKPSNYVVYALPSAPSNHTLTIGGLYEAFRILGPLVTVLNADGQPIRTFSAERFANVGSTFGVQFRPSDDARFVLVQTNPQSAGSKCGRLRHNSSPKPITPIIPIRMAAVPTRHNMAGKGQRFANSRTRVLFR